MVDEITLLFQPPHPETFHEMEQRVHHHNDRMRDYDLTRRPVWIITHGLIIDRLLFFMGFKRPQSIPTLSFFVFHQTEGDKAQVRGGTIVLRRLGVSSADGCLVISLDIRLLGKASTTDRDVALTSTDQDSLA